MDHQTFDYILEAMNETFSLLEDIGNEDYKRETAKLGMAIDEFYNWYKTQDNANQKIVDEIKKVFETPGFPEDREDDVYEIMKKYGKLD